jgi:hypothetical protein
LVASLLRNNLYIGRSNWAQDNYYGGDQRDFKIWNRALSAAEIKDSFQQKPLLGNESGLLAYYPMDGSTANLSTNANKLGDLTLYNGARFAPDAAPPGTVYGNEDDASVSLQGMAIQDVEPRRSR